VTSKASIDQALSSLPPDWQDVDVLINNAGLALGLEPAHEAHLSDWDTMIATNCTGLVTITRALLPRMVARGAGLVINLGSVAGAYPYPGGNVYGATKAFVDQFTLNLRADLVGTGVRATNIAPGMSGGTEFSNVRFKGDDTAAAKVYQGAMALTPEDIAEAAWWVASLPAHVNINGIEMMPTCQLSDEQRIPLAPACLLRRHGCRRHCLLCQLPEIFRAGAHGMAAHCRHRPTATVG
jgi:3-hydroxy acid dehydrogenase/malonic semialdehyde reductase